MISGTYQGISTVLGHVAKNTILLFSGYFWKQNKRLPDIPEVSIIVNDLLNMLHDIEKKKNKMHLINKITLTTERLTIVVKENHIEKTVKKIALGTLFDRSVWIFHVYKDGYGHHSIMLSDMTRKSINQHEPYLTPQHVVYEYSNGRYEKLKAKLSQRGDILQPERIDIEYILNAATQHKLFCNID